MKKLRFNDTLAVRLKQADRELIERAAEKIGVSLSDLAREGATAIAKHILSESESDSQAGI